MRGLAAFGMGAALFFVQSGVAQMGAPDTPPPVSMPSISGPLAAKYKADADRILKAGETDDDGYVALTYLCDHIGKRLSGSPQLNTAVALGAWRGVGSDRCAGDEAAAYAGARHERGHAEGWHYG
jgi:hypothetical protein